MADSGDNGRTRQQGLIEAGVALSSELSLDALLKKLVELAAEMTGARYAAMGVINEERTGLERFIYTGISDEEAARIGSLPVGRGLLGVLVEEAKPLRLKSISDDARSVGFPDNHPPMRGFLGVPVLLRGRTFGNLYLTEKSAGDFTQEDEDLVMTLAGQAAVAIENARLYEAARNWSRQLEYLTEVGNAIAAEHDLPRLLSLITRHLRALIDAKLVLIALPALGGNLRVEAADGTSAAEIHGLELDWDSSKSGRVLERKQAERIDELASDPEIDQKIARKADAHSGLYVPLLAGDRAIGVLIAHDRVGKDPRFRTEDLRLAQTFASRAAIAVDLSARVAKDALRRVVEAQEVERRRLARELHDQTGQEITSALLGLKTAEEAPDEQARLAALQSVRAQLVDTLQGVRRLAVELRPKALDDFGLEPALERLAGTFSEQTSIAIDLVAQMGPERLSDEIETAFYRLVQEALTNVVKHAQATQVSIVLSRKDGRVMALVEDDGRGFDIEIPSEGLGLSGMRERLALVGGRLKIESSPGTGTTLAAEVPV